MAKHPRRDRKRNDQPTIPEEPGWRLFLAVPLPSEVKRQLAEIVDELAPLGWPVRWVAPETTHITLHFLGETAPERAELLRLALPAAIKNEPAFKLQTAGLGVFPNPRRPRVLWLGLDDPGQQLARLHRELARLLASLDFPVEAGRFHPHITLGRLREVQDADPAALAGQMQERLRRISDTLVAQPVPVNEVMLYRSFLSREGARHQSLVAVPLTADPAATGL